MGNVLCIDFGTSSIRTALSTSGGKRHVLPLGKTVNGRELDRASLPCEIYIDRTGKRIIFGERARIEQERNLNNRYQVRSPKLWLSDPTLLRRPTFTNFELTRRDLLIGILAYAFSVISDTLRAENLDFSFSLSNIRVAHPVWPKTIADSINVVFEDIVRRAFRLREHIDSDEIGASELRTYINSLKKLDSCKVNLAIEPIAAALQISYEDSNLRRLIMVVDVGAGTTDMGMFAFVQTSSRNNRLIPFSSVRSIFKAGDEIDNALVQLLMKKSGSVDLLKQRDIENRIRQIKRTLFNNGQVVELGVKVEIDELTETEHIQRMVDDIRREFEEIVMERINEAIEWTKSAAYHRPYVEVIMAGGGARLNFLITALKEPIVIDSQNRIDFKVVLPKDESYLEKYEADICRLAVCLGGAHQDYDDLETALEEKNLKIRTLGQAKQSISPIHLAPQPQKIIHSAFSISTEIRHIASQKRVDEQRLKDWSDRRKELGAKAKGGDPRYQYDLGSFLLDGPLEFSKAYRKTAIELLISSASRGNGNAAFKLSSILSDAQFGECDYKEALSWLLLWRLLSGAEDSSHLEIIIRKKLNEQLISEAVSRAKIRYETIISSERVKVQPKAHRSGGTVSSERSQRYGATLHFNDRLKILELKNRSIRLKPPPFDISENDLLQWSSSRQIFEAVFLACLVSKEFPYKRFLKSPEEVQRLQEWLRDKDHKRH